MGERNTPRESSRKEQKTEFFGSSLLTEYKCEEESNQ